MLLSSILRILDQNKLQPSHSEHTQNPKHLPGIDESSGLQRIEKEITAAAELARPSENSEAQPGNPPAGPFVEELLRAITKFEKSDQSRVVDVFE